MGLLDAATSAESPVDLTRGASGNIDIATNFRLVSPDCSLGWPGNLFYTASRLDWNLD